LGEVTFTTSRESLEMNALTVGTINRYIKTIQDSFAADCQKQIDDCDSPFAAICLYNNMDGLKKKALADINWNGTPLDLKVANALTYTSYDRNRKQWKQVIDRPWSYKDSAGFIINDGGFPPSQTGARLLEARDKLIASGKQNIFYIRESVEKSKEILDLPEFDGLDRVVLSDIAANIVKNRSKNGFKDSEKFFKWNGKSSFPYSNCWESVVPDPHKKAVYVIIDAFAPVIECMYADNKSRWHFLDNLKNRIVNELGVEDFELYGVKTSQKSKISTNWVSLSEYLRTMVQDIVDKPEYQDQYIKDKVVEKISNNWFVRNVFDKIFQPYINDVECPQMKKVLLTADDSKCKNYQAQANFINYIGNKVKIEDIMTDFKAKANANVIKKSQDICDAVDYCVKHYPLLNGFDTSVYSYTRLNATNAQHLVKYVNTFYRASVNGW
jgi:hypothetical protein